MSGHVVTSSGSRLPERAARVAALLLCLFLSSPAQTMAIESVTEVSAPTASPPNGPPATGGESMPAIVPASDKQAGEGQLSTLPTDTLAPGQALPATAPTGTGAVPEPGRHDGAGQERDFFDTMHRGISSRLLTSADWLDSFFGDERYEAEINRSQFKVREEAFREARSGMNYRKPNFDLKLVLPQMRKKTKLLISGDPREETDTTTVQPGGTAAAQPKVPERSLTTALQVVPVETLESHFSIRVGVKYRTGSGKFELLAGPRYRYLVPFEIWAFRFTQEFPWSSRMRWESRTRFDLERPLPEGFFFRSSLEGLWSENVVGYSYNLSFTLRQPLDRDRALQYEWINTFTTEPFNGLIEELLVFRYRQRFLREWLFLEIAPQYRFPRNRSFDALPGIFFRLEMVFGDIRHIF